MEKKATDDTLLRIAMLVGTCTDKLKESDLPCINGIYALEDFEISLTSKHPAGAITGKPMFDFWRKRKRRELWTRFDGELNSFVLHKESEEKRIVFEEYIGLRIEEFIKTYPVYPQFRLIWTGIGSKRKAQKGVLVLARINFSNTMIVSYEYLEGSYHVYNSHDLDLAKLGLPADLGKATIVLGQPIERRIDFDAKKKELLEISGLEELSREINLLTK
ncbi:MAG: hypothetical protein WC788_05945 [Candidatus Paceibacterota bacterium]|jgi:hypothetical protein